MTAPDGALDPTQRDPSAQADDGEGGGGEEDERPLDQLGAKRGDVGPQLGAQPGTQLGETLPRPAPA